MLFLCVFSCGVLTERSWREVWCHYRRLVRSNWWVIVFHFFFFFVKLLSAHFSYCLFYALLNFFDRAGTGVGREAVLWHASKGSEAWRCPMQPSREHVASHTPNSRHALHLPSEFQGISSLCLDQCPHLSQVILSHALFTVFRFWFWSIRWGISRDLVSLKFN